MLLTLFIFVASAAAIYLACEYFVNAVEWCGHGLQMGTLAVGSLLAAFGTALPESLVTFVAVVFGHSEAEKQLGVGAALGGPLVLSTIAYAIVGVALLLRMRSTRNYSPIAASRTGVQRDQFLFLLLFVFNLSLGLLNFAGKRWCALLFVVAYLVYAFRRMREEGAVAEAEELEPLKLRPSNPTLGWASLQALVALSVITIASKVFVAQLGAMGAALHFPPQLAALLLSPVATELPETLNAIVWVRQGKVRLALANISGSMMIQATIPAALGVFFTNWQFDSSLRLSALITLAAILLLWLSFRTGWVRPSALLSVSLLYVVFGCAVAYTLAHRWQHIPAADHARQNPFAGQPQAIRTGQQLFSSHCLECHQSGGRGPGLQGGALRKASDGDVDWFLAQGSLGQGMPSWRTLSSDDRWQIVSYLRSLQ